MRDEDYLRAEIRWLIERARVALGLPTSAVVGCTEEQIARVLEAQELQALPPPLDELLRVAGVYDHGTVLAELQPGTGVGWKEMLYAKDNARKTAEYTRSQETFGPDRAVFLSDPGGTVLWVATDEQDSPVWALSEGSPIIALGYTRLGCWLEYEVRLVEEALASGRFSRRGP